MRSALRLLCGCNNTLFHIEAAGCFQGSPMGAQTLNVVNPGGKYSLHLRRPYHRSILRMLYKICDHFNQQPDQAFESVKYTKARGAQWSHATKGACGRFE